MRFARCTHGVLRGFALLLLLTPSLFGAGDRRYVSERFGFRIDRPSDEWSYFAAESEGNALFTLSLYPRGTLGIPSLVVFVSARPAGTTIPAFCDAQREKLAAFGTRDFERGETSIAGTEVPWIGCVVEDKSLGTYRVRYAFVGSDRYVYTLQRAEHLGHGSEGDDLDAMAASFATFPAKDDPVDAETAKWKELAARCGSEIGWCKSWSAAAELAKREGKLVLVAFESYEGLGLPSVLPSGPLMDLDVVALANERFVCWRMGKNDDAPFRKPDAYGIGKHAFGSAFLIADAEGNLLRETSVVNASCLAEFMRDALAEHTREPAADKPPTGITDARGHQLRAALLARQRNGKEALAELDAARRVGDESTAIDIAIDEAVILMRMAQYEESQATFERAMKMDPHSRRVPEALFWLGAYDVLSKGLDAGGARWRKLVDEYPENRWAWKAAANLAKVGCLMLGAERLAWPEPELVAAVARPHAEPLAATEIDRVERDAVAYLVKSQRPDGTWINPADAFSLGSSLYTPAVCALSATSLLPFVAEKKPAACVSSAIAHLSELERAGKLEPGPGIVGPYSIWSRTCTLLFFARCVRAHVGDEGELTRAMGELVASIAKSQHAHGGWPYIAFAGDPTGEGFDPSASFLTSGVVLALAEARESDVEVPTDVLEKAVAFLERMRQSDGSYRYMPDIANAIVDGSAPEAAGRGPLCSLAIERGELALGREKEHATAPSAGNAGSSDATAADAARVQRARDVLEAFVKHRAGFKREWHKELCHTSPEGFGAHYIFYDYLFAAACVRSLPRDERARYRSLIAEDVLAARFADGSFEDLPLLGRAYATAMALMTLRELRSE